MSDTSKLHTEVESRATGRFEGRVPDLTRLLEPAGGEWAVVIDDLDGKGSLSFDAASPFTAASVIKIPIMMTPSPPRYKIRLDDTKSSGMR